MISFRKLDGIRVSLDYEMRCEAASNVEYREIEISYEINSRVYETEYRTFYLEKYF